MSTKTKKITKKPAAAKKPVAKKPAAKKSAPAAKKPVAKPAPAAKKPMAKKPVAKKPAAAKKPEPKKPVAKKTVEKKGETKPSGASKKPVRVVPKKPEETISFENQSQDFAFSFAEQMKKMHRADEERKQQDASAIKLSRRPTTRAKGKNTQQFPAADLAEFRKRLILLRQEAIGQSNTLRTIALEQTEERGSEDEDGSDVFMRLQNLSQVDSQNKIVQKIDEALHRIADGTYGICEVCGQLIRKPRLMNLPFVHTCMECQSAMENPFGSH